MTRTTTCPRCGEEARGNFCPQCGGALGGRHCTQCGEEIKAGSRFCTACGSPAAASPAPGVETAPAGGEGGTSPLVWWGAGAVMVALILFLVYPIVRPEPPPPPAPGTAVGAGAPPASGPAAVDLTSMTPREAADRLFDRVMRSAASGDSAQAQQFLPMAIQAYERVRPLDADGAFHLSLLQRTAGDLEGARATAREALESYPDHLLVRGAAGAAALEAGDRTAAEEHYAHLLEVWDAQMDLGLPEYEAHASLLPELRADAREVTGS